jgi:DNA-binding transcriptional LysR family regulator
MVGSADRFRYLEIELNLKQLNAFREVMLTGSVSEAARNLYRTQPAISSLIAGLEKDIGFKLFARRGGRLHPVPEAHYLFEEAGEIIGRLDVAERTIKSVRDLDRGTIRIASMAGPSVFMLPDLISRFVEGREQVQVSLITRSSIEVQQLVSVQQYDMGLADLGFVGTTRSPLVNHEVMRFECLCAMPAGDPLADQECVTAADLDGKPMATLHPDHPTFTDTKAAFAEMGARLNVCFETVYFIPMFTYLERGLAYAVVDPLSAESYKLFSGGEPRIVFRPFRPAIHLVASIMTPAHRPISNLAQSFHALLRDEVHRIGEAYSAAGDAGVTPPA